MKDCIPDRQNEKNKNSKIEETYFSLYGSSNAIVPVFLYDDYRIYLLELVDLRRDLRGLRSRLAQAAQCQLSYFTQVLQGEAQFSLDQLFGISRFLELKPPEWEFLRELWLLSRAVSPALRKSCLEKIQIFRKKYGGEIGAPENYIGEINTEKYELFGTSWHHGAIYVALEIKHLRTLSSLVQRFAISRDRVYEVLQDLCQMGLAKEQNGLWIQTSRNFYMDQRSPICKMYQTAWYMKGLENYYNHSKKFHRSGASFALPKNTFLELQDTMKKMMHDLFRSNENQEKDIVAYVGFDCFEI